MGDSFRYPQGCKLEQGNSRIFLPKVGWLRYRNSRPILGKVCNVTVSQSGGKWFASVQTRRQVDAVQPTGGIIGIDLGIARFATLSDGTYLQPLHSFKQHQQQLKRYQRRMARKVKFSQNWRKAKANVSLVELYRRAQVLRVISFDRKLLGIDTSVRKRAKGEVTGFLYGLKSIWDFLFGGVVELNESNRDAVREILRGQVRETVDLLESAVDGWGEQGKRVSHQASAEYAERRESLSAKKVDFAHYAEGLQRKLRFLSNCEPPVRDLCSRIAEFADRLDKANARIKASRQPDFSAVLFTDDGELTLRKDRGQDLLLLSDLDKCKCRWKLLEIRSGGWSSHYFPVVRGGGKRVTFIQERAIGRGNDEPILVPDGAIRFELRLSTLDGNFVVGRRSVSTVPAEQIPNGPDASSPKRASG